MLSKSKIKEISSLHQKKYRQGSGLFIVEGEKIVDELIHAEEELIEMFATADLYEKFLSKAPKIQLTEPHTFSKISALKTPSGILAVAKQRHSNISATSLKNKFTLCLDGVRDPGNLGTIIRIADWFGIENIVCSEDTVDLYNPKVIQSTMGSFLRVQLMYTSLYSIINKAKAENIPVYGATLQGENIYDITPTNQGIILMGSESHGISKDLQLLIDKAITIPSKLLSMEANKYNKKVDSLNVAVASSIICAVFSTPHATAIK